MRQVRTRPTFSDRTSPLASSTCEMLHHRRQGHVERLGELAHRGRALAQPLDHDAAGRVGQGLEGEIEGRLIVKHTLNYCANPRFSRAFSTPVSYGQAPAAWVTTSGSLQAEQALP